MTDREKVVNNLTMLKGIKEGSAEHKMIIKKFNDSKLCTRYKMTVNDAWCATSVSYAFIVAKLAGKPGSDALFQCVECSCARMIELGKKQGIFVEKDNYVPSKGDVIFYDWQDSAEGDNKGTPDHVGIVEYVNGDYIHVIEGNKNDTVGERTIKVNGKYIRGFIVPKYKTVKYFPAYKGASTSIVDALKAVGVENPTLLYRRKIAKANDISNYVGTASQNIRMLVMLEKGKLIKP